jgi:myo-inositol-1-phosphate synthase
MGELLRLQPHVGEQRLAVLLPGLGAVATTAIAGIEAVKRGLGAPIGSLTQTGELQDEHGAAGAPLRSVLPLASMDGLCFGAWDPFPDNAFQSALKARVLDAALVNELRRELEPIQPMAAVFDPQWVKRLDGPNVKKGSKRAMGEALCEDIQRFLEANHCTRGVMVWTASTEAYSELGPAHRSLRAFEAALDRNDPTISPSQIYAWAALRSGLPFANGAPNLTTEIPALKELAEREGMPTCGKDFKTGQTLLKTTIAPMLRARLLGLEGWFSTNILGNRDGEVLDDAASFRTKEVSKLGVLSSILDAERHPELYAAMEHKVCINYYKARGDNKEAWDAIDFFGWLGYPMQIKVNFQCRDSILAAPLVLDLALLLDLARRAGEAGPQEWLSFFFKSPVTAKEGMAVHELFLQERNLQERLRRYARGAVATEEAAGAKA